MPTIQKTLRILEYIDRYTRLNYQPPTLREIAKEFNFRSLTSAHNHLKKMEARGWITRTPHVSRGIRIAHPPQRRAA